MTAPKLRIALYVAGVVAALTILAANVYFRIRAYDDMVLQFNNAREFCLYVTRRDDNGTYPRKIPDFPNDKAGPSPQARHFHDHATGRELDWIYFGGYSDKEAPPKILLASPRMLGDRKRIMLMTDGSGEVIDEDAFVMRLSEQLNGK